MRKTTFIISIVLILTIFASNFTALAYTPTFEVKAENVLLVNTNTDDVLYSKNADGKIMPTSLTYLMVALLTYESVSDLSTVVTVDKSVADELLGTGALVSDIKDGEQLTVDQLLHFMLISSYNDVALFLADYVSGSVDKFVSAMNNRAQSLGMDNTAFVTPIGLSKNGQYTTANDLYILSKTVFEIDHLADIMKKPRQTIDLTNLTSADRILVNTNFMLSAGSNYYYKYMVMGKTGNGDEGRCFASMATKDGETYICIVAKCADKNARNEFESTKNLYKWAFNNFTYKTIVEAGELVPVSADIAHSWEKDNITLSAGNTVVALLPKDADMSTIEYKAELAKETFNAPVKKGEVLGTASILFANETIGTVQLVASEDVEGSVVLLIWSFFENIFTNPVVLVLISLLIVGFIVLTVVVNIKAKKARDKRVRLKKRL